MLRRVKYRIPALVVLTNTSSISGTDALWKIVIVSGQDEFSYKGKMRRRKKASDGKAFDAGLGDQLDAMQPLKDSGLFCMDCRKWWKWKDFSIEFEQLELGKFLRRWVCKCGTMIKEETLL